MKNSSSIVTKIFPMWVIFIIALLFPKETKSQFANGADIGWLSQMESASYVFKNSSGVQENCMTILKEKKINALRFRVWVNPTGGWCGKKDVATMAHRADSMGFSVLLDFHMSDTWADPGHQTKPVAWATHTTIQLDTDVYNHVYNILDTLKSLGVTPKWVQIGNETNDGMLWEDGRASTHMDNFASFIRSGYNAVKAVDSTIQVIVHLSNGHDDGMYRKIFDGLKNNGAQWDIIGMSVYPYWAGLTWAVDDSLALITMKDMISRYATKVMVVESGYFYYQPTDAYNYLVDLLQKTKSVGGLGVFYWEPECYNWQGYNMGAWNPSTKEPTIALDAFLDTVATSVAKEASVPVDYKLNNYPNPFNPSTTIEYTIIRHSQVLLNIYNILGQNIATLVNAVKNPGKYSVIWNGLDNTGKSVASGMYIVSLSTEGIKLTHKISLVK